MRPAGALQEHGKRGPATSQQIGRIANWRHERLNLPACTVRHFEGCDFLESKWGKVHALRSTNSITLVVRTSELSPKVAVYIRNLIRQQTSE